MAVIVLDPDPKSMIGASQEYIDAWLATYNTTPPSGDIVLDPDPRSTYEASDEYIAAWFAAYGDGSPEEPPPPPPPVAEKYVISENVLPDYLRRDTINTYIDAEVAEGLADYNPTVVEQFQFVTASTEWVCQHNFAMQLVDVVTVDSNGDEIIGDVSFEPDNRVVIRWGVPQTGTVRLST